MKLSGRQRQRGFSLVEVQAVVLMLSVLAGVAVPLYISTRRSAAARACKANLAAIASAEAAFAMQWGQYAQNPNSNFDPRDPTAPTSGLVGALQGLSKPVYCPLDERPYTIIGGGPGEALTIGCPHRGRAFGGGNDHEAASPSRPPGSDNYSITLAALPPEP